MKEWGDLFNWIGWVVALLFAYVLFRKSNRQKALGVKKTVDLVLQPTETIDGLKVTWKDIPLQFLYRVTIQIWNAGASPILGKDVSKKDKLRLLIDPKKFAFISPESRQSTAPRVAFADQPQDEPEIILEFSHLEPRDGFAISYLIGSDSRLTNDAIAVKGSIVGIPKIGVVRRNLDELAVWFFGVTGYALIFFGPMVLILMQVLSLPPAPDFHPIISITITIIAIGVLIAFGVGCAVLGHRLLGICEKYANRRTTPPTALGTQFSEPLAASKHYRLEKK